MVQPFYVDTTGAWVLGYNQENGAGSQLQAGARAELIADPITQALSTFGGRIAAQTMQYMFRGNVTALLNYAAIRPYVMMDAIRFALGDSPDDKIVLNPAGGYSPVCYWLANQLSKTHFIEMDISKTIDTKRTVLAPYGFPDNFQLLDADLKEHDLHTIQNERVDVVVVAGTYVIHSDFRDMLKYIKNILKEDAYIISAFPNKDGIENYLENAAVFSRIVNPPKGVINTEDDLGAIFKGTGFVLRKVLKFSEFAKKHNNSKPADIEVIAIAQVGEDDVEGEIITQEELEILAELNGSANSKPPEDRVPPFSHYDMESFKRFPRRYRRTPPKSKS